MMHVLRSMLFVAIASTVGFTAEAREIDTEKTVSTEQIELGKDLPKTLVIRKKIGTNETEVMHSNLELGKDDATKQLVSTSSFIKVDKEGKMVGELDRDSSSSSWFFNCYNWYYPSYYYYGFNYNYVSYYSYAYAGYSYAYYGWPYYNRWCW